MNFFKTNQPKPPGASTIAMDAITNITGVFGKYQLILCALVFICKFFIAFHQLAIIFLAPKVEFTCDEEVNKCPCDDPVYNRSVFANTITMQWNLICGSSWKAAFSQSWFQVGVLFGSLVFGILADKFGRKLPLCAACMMMFVVGVGAALIDNYWLFSILRLIIGLAVGGMMVTSFVLLMEFIGAKYRGPMSAAYQIPHTLGHMMLPGISYFFRDYVDFQLLISAPALIMIIYFIFLPETPRWLIAKKRPEKAIKILKRCAKINNRPTENVADIVSEYQAQIERSKLELQTKGTLADLFRTPNLRKNIICMSFLWFTCSYTYYGVAQYVSHITGNIFQNVAISAGFCTMGTILTIYLITVLGRRTICAVTNAISGVCLVVVAFLPEGVITIILATVGVVSSFITFITVYPYCGEMFPTVVRNAALGFSSMMARVGSIIAPLVAETDDYAKWLPPILFGMFPLIAALITLLLPETKGYPLMTTLAEGEKFGREQRSMISNLVLRKK